MPLTFRPIAGWLTPEMTTQRNAWRSFKTHFLSTVVTLSWIARGLALRYVCVLQMSLLGLLACFQAPCLKTIGNYLLRLLFSSSLPWLVQLFETQWVTSSRAYDGDCTRGRGKGCITHRGNISSLWAKLWLWEPVCFQDSGVWQLGPCEVMWGTLPETVQGSLSCVVRSVVWALWVIRLTPTRCNLKLQW